MKRFTCTTAPIHLVDYTAYSDASGVNGKVAIMGLRFAMQWLGGEGHEAIKCDLVGPAYGTSSRQLHIAAQRARNFFASVVRERTTQAYRDATRAMYAAAG